MLGSSLLVGELQRIASHLVAVGSLAADLSALGVSSFVYPFRGREGILSLFEALGGSRFNVNYQRVGGVLHDFPKGLFYRHTALDEMGFHFLMIGK